MLDKDIDKLFQKRFETYEMAPADFVWDIISDNLDENKSKKLFNPAIWKFAASCLIFLSAALWFYRPHEVIKLHGKSEVLSNNDISVTTVVVKPVLKETYIAKSSNKEKPVKKQNSIKDDRLKHENAFLSSQKIESVMANSINISHSNSDIEPVHIETVYTPRHENMTGVVVATKLDFAESQLIESEAPKIKIRSIGSLVNFVIAKVDHREDKIIEFEDNDEGSEVSGINLGVLKFKSRKKQ